MQSPNTTFVPRSTLLVTPSSKWDKWDKESFMETLGNGLGEDEQIHQRPHTKFHQIQAALEDLKQTIDAKLDDGGSLVPAGSGDLSQDPKSDSPENQEDTAGRKLEEMKKWMTEIEREVGEEKLKTQKREKRLGHKLERSKNALETEKTNAKIESSKLLVLQKANGELGERYKQLRGGVSGVLLQMKTGAGGNGDKFSPNSEAKITELESQLAKTTAELEAEKNRMEQKEKDLELVQAANSQLGERYEGLKESLEKILVQIQTKSKGKPKTKRSAAEAKVNKLEAQLISTTAQLGAAKKQIALMQRSDKKKPAQRKPKVGKKKAVAKPKPGPSIN